jgi:dTDP-4-dehydrorhamnose 3,5-epimerase-like enzyme
MKVVAIQDLLIIVPTVYKDNRYFYEAYNQEVFAKMTLLTSSFKTTQLFKARCYQRITFVKPYVQAKLIRCCKVKFWM